MWRRQEGRVFRVEPFRRGRSAAWPEQWVHSTYWSLVWHSSPFPKDSQWLCTVAVGPCVACSLLTKYWHFLGPVSLDPQSCHLPGHFAPCAYPFRVWIGYHLGLEKVGGQRAIQHRLHGVVTTGRCFEGHHFIPLFIQLLGPFQPPSLGPPVVYHHPYLLLLLRWGHHDLRRCSQLVTLAHPWQRWSCHLRAFSGGRGCGGWVKEKDEWESQVVLLG